MSTLNIEFSKKIFSLLLILTAIDQLIKICIKYCFFDWSFYLTGNLGFRPYLNTAQLSVFNRELGLNVGIWPLILINIAAIPFMLFIQKKFTREEKHGRELLFWSTIVEAGLICSLFDKFVWGGSLDYILLFSSIVDLKDIYMFVGFAMIVFWLLYPRLIKKS